MDRCEEAGEDLDYIPYGANDPQNHVHSNGKFENGVNGKHHSNGTNGHHPIIEANGKSTPTANSDSEVLQKVMNGKHENGSNGIGNGHHLTCAKENGSSKEDNNQEECEQKVDSEGSFAKGDGEVDGLVSSAFSKLRSNKWQSGSEEKKSSNGASQLYPQLNSSGTDPLADRIDAWPSLKSRPTIPVTNAPRDFFSYRYCMSHPKRGYAVIINNREFIMPGTPARKGSDSDAANLKKTLTGLGFTVGEYTDLSAEDMKACADYYANKLTHTDCDMFFMSIFTHGEDSNVIYASDKKIKLEDMTSPFRADRCLSLAGKPKMFVIQACRGDQLDRGVDLVDTDAGEVYRMPAEADYLYAFSTVPGYYSWRNTELGSWFIQSFCRTLVEHAYNPDFDVMALLTMVSYEVAFGYESNVPSDSSWHRKKQVPSFTSMLTKRLFFTPKDGSGNAK